MTRAIEAIALIAVLAGCTSDLELGTRPSSCDPNTTTCACTGTPECPNDYYCQLDNNVEEGTCVLAPSCDNANACNDPNLTCCQIDHVCYPPSCADCCE